MKIPGFVDLQINGYNKVDFSDSQLTEAAFLDACDMIFDSGTAAFLPTLITSSRQTYQKLLPLYANILSGDRYKGRLLGLHLEGPFISPVPGAVGAHNPDWVCNPSVDYLKEIQDWADGHIKLITIAAEREGAEELTRYATQSGIAVSLGHQLATEEDLERLTQAGAVACTHLGNGIPNDLNRHQNPLLAGLTADGLTAMIITDGNHLPNSLIKLTIRAKGVSKIIITGDAAPLAGLEPGEYFYWDQNVVLEESGRLYNRERQCLVGSTAMMLHCMNYLASLNILTEEELIKVGFENPLRLIGTEPAAVAAGNTQVQFDKEANRFEMIDV